jgi:PAS domain-containing protein
LILNDHGICLEANPAAQTILGTRRDELVGEPIGKFYGGVTTSRPLGGGFSIASASIARHRLSGETARPSSSNTQRRRITCPESMLPPCGTSPAGSRRKRRCARAKNDSSRWPPTSRRFSGCWTLRT